MKKFSWHSEPGLAPHWYKIYGWLPNRYLPIVMFGDSIPIYKPNMKGGHNHRRNYCICSVCGKWFRRNKGRHYDYSDGTYHFCCGPCDEQAQFEAYLEKDVGGGFCPHYWDDEGDAEWRKKKCLQ